ncbi:MAG: hypothetical protein IJI77_06055 [Erysipelotrichaceae bacterium]|nr:hypothetical protein [Erysipelotrichaceae bacterium]
MNKEKFEIELLSRNYLNSKRIIKETEEDIIHTSYERLKAYRRIVSHIENVAEGLGEKERLIIQKEVIEKKRQMVSGILLRSFLLPSSQKSLFRVSALSVNIKKSIMMLENEGVNLC